MEKDETDRRTMDAGRVRKKSRLRLGSDDDTVPLGGSSDGCLSRLSEWRKRERDGLSG
ncbi:MAG: hypothetical protein ACLFSW_07190 [Halobacteriales archaeon]